MIGPDQDWVDEQRRAAKQRKENERKAAARVTASPSASMSIAEKVAAYEHLYETTRTSEGAQMINGVVIPKYCLSGLHELATQNCNCVNPPTPEGAQPEITPQMLDAMEGIGGTLCTAHADCPLPHEEHEKIATLLRALSPSGSHGTYDRRTQRVVDVSELEAWRNGLLKCATLAPPNQAAEMESFAEIIYSVIRGNE